MTGPFFPRRLSRQTFISCIGIRFIYVHTDGVFVCARRRKHMYRTNALQNSRIRSTGDIMKRTRSTELIISNRSTSHILGRRSVFPDFPSEVLSTLNRIGCLIHEHIANPESSRHRSRGHCMMRRIRICRIAIRKSEISLFDHLCNPVVVMS